MELNSDAKIAKLAPLAGKDRMERIGPALYLRVKATGTKAFVLRLQHGGKDRWRVIGHPPTMKLAEAEAIAYARKAGTAVVPTTTLTCAQALELFQRQYIERQWKQTRNPAVYNRYLIEELAGAPLRQLSRQQISFAVQNYAKRKTAKAGRTGGRVAQNRLLAYAKLWLRWCVENGYLERNPADTLTTRYAAGGKETARERVLSLAEMRALWALDSPHAPLLRALLLTGCRIRELQQAKAGDLHVDPDAPEDGPLSLTIPKEHSKNKREHRVPLTTAALMQMNISGKPAQPLFDSSTSAFAVQSWLLRWHTREGTTPWTPHDLRRTFATLLGELGVPLETIQRCLNHTLDGAIARYARADYFPQRREALEKLAGWLNQKVAAPAEFEPLP